MKITFALCALAMLVLTGCGLGNFLTDERDEADWSAERTAELWERDENWGRSTAYDLRPFVLEIFKEPAQDAIHTLHKSTCSKSEIKDLIKHGDLSLVFYNGEPVISSDRLRWMGQNRGDITTETYYRKSKDDARATLARCGICF